MKNKTQKQDKRYINLAINGLGLSTGLISYLPFYILKNEQYLNSSDAYNFQKDLIIFISSIILFLIIIFVWFKIYKQFKKDRTVLGFSSNTKGSTVVITAIIESLTPILILLFST